MNLFNMPKPVLSSSKALTTVGAEMGECIGVNQLMVSKLGRSSKASGTLAALLGFVLVFHMHHNNVSFEFRLRQKTFPTLITHGPIIVLFGMFVEPFLTWEGS